MILGIGETILDIIFKNDQPQAAVPGGSTFNAMISLGRMGVPCTMVTEVGDDHVGDIIVNFLRDNNVGCEYVNRKKGTKSHVSLAFLDDDNNAQYSFYKNHAHASIENRYPQPKADDIILFGSFFAVNPVIRDVVKPFLQKAHDAGAMLYYDINFRASHIDEIPQLLPAIQENMTLATIVRGSLEDFGYLYGTTNVDEIYEKHISPFCKVFICTNGGEPITVHTPLLRASFAANPIKTVSTIGAGDNFNAGFVYACQTNGRRDFANMPEDQWAPLVAMGQRFSAEVCQSLDNYIAPPCPPRWGRVES